MDEHQLSREKREQIDRIKKEWAQEAKAFLSEYKQQAAFDRTCDIKLHEIEEKYRGRIRKAVET